MYIVQIFSEGKIISTPINGSILNNNGKYKKEGIK